jgi:hypothetical protein
MKTTSRSLLAALAAALLTALPASAADKVEQWINLMPKDTVGVLAFKSMPELLADWDKSAMGRFMQDEETLRWLEPMKEDGMMPWDKHFTDIYGTGLYDTLKIERGAAVGFFVLGDPKEMESKDGPPFIGLSEVTDNQSLQEEHKRKHREHLKKDKHPDLKEDTIDIAGVSVSIATESDKEGAKWVDAYAIVDGVMIEAKNRKLMEYMIGAVKSGSGDAPGEIRDHFSRLSQLREGFADVTIYVNGTRVLDLAKKAMAEAAKKEDKKAAAPNPLGDIKPEQIMATLGVDELKGIAITMDFADDRSTSDVVIFHSEKPAGFLSWVRSDAKQVELPNFIAAGVTSGQVGHVEWLKLYDGIMGTVTKLSPQMGMMAAMYLGGFETQNGFKIRDDFFGSLSGDNFQVQDADGTTPSEVYGFKVKDADKLGTALKGIKNALGGMGFAAFDESDYLGYKLNTFKMTTANAAGGAPAANMPEIAYCDTGKYLLIGSGTLETLRKTLSRMKDPSGPSIWETPTAQAQMALIPRDFNGLAIADSAKIITLVFNAMEMVSKQAASQKKSASKKKGPGKGPKGGKSDDSSAGADAGDMLAKFVDSKNRPADATFQKYFGNMMSANYTHPDALHMHSITTPVEAK